MIIELPATRKDNAFVTSNNDAVDAGRGELIRWLVENGFWNDAQENVFAIFDHGRVIREWAIVEKPRTPA